MWVHPKQLVPGCLILKDVEGKTSRPIVPKNTEVQKQHIEILNKFLIEEVEVDARLSNGVPFHPKEIVELTEENGEKQTENIGEKLTFEELYMEKIEKYKQLFIGWQNGDSLNLSAVKQVIIPLLLRSEELGLRLYALPCFSTKKDYFYHHGIATALIAAFLAKKSGYTKDWIQIGLTGFLADSGMSQISAYLFLKEERLTDWEHQEIKKHPTYSYRLVEEIVSLPQEVKLGVLQHHERLDGSGYPLGIGAEKIHMYARFVAVADTYHAMTSERYYQTRQSPFKVIEEMLHDQFGKFDRRIVETFIESLTNFSTGAKVRLSNNQLAEIVFIENQYPTRPLVRLQKDNQLVPLKSNTSIFIEEIVR